MDPYRSPPPAPAPDERELDRLAVFGRFAPIRLGWLIVTPTSLRFEPRLGRMRSVAVVDGIPALRLSMLIDPDARLERHAITTFDTVRTWQYVLASAVYERPLASAPNDGILLHAYAQLGAGSPYARDPYTAVLDGDRCVLINGRMLERCFELPAALELADTTGRTLGLALRWLRPDVLAEVLARIVPRRGRDANRHVRVLTRDGVRAWRPLTVDGTSYRLLGPPDDAVALDLTAREAATLDRWLAATSV